MADSGAQTLISCCKILDLEITNKSLLAINATLERTKLSQATELRDLRRAVREGHFSSTSSLPLHSAPLARNSEFSPLRSPELGYFLDSAGEEDEMPWDEVLCKDPGFGEVVRALETLHVRALQALQKTSSSAAIEIGGKVLSQFALEQQQPSGLQRPPLSPGKGSGRRRGRTVSSSGTGQEATPRVKHGFTHPVRPPSQDTEADTPDTSTVDTTSTSAADETGATATSTEDEESLTSSAYLEESIDDRSRTSSAHTAEMSLGVD